MLRYHVVWMLCINVSKKLATIAVNVDVLSTMNMDVGDFL